MARTGIQEALHRTDAQTPASSPFAVYGVVRMYSARLAFFQRSAVLPAISSTGLALLREPYIIPRVRHIEKVAAHSSTVYGVLSSRSTPTDNHSMASGGVRVEERSRPSGVHFEIPRMHLHAFASEPQPFGCRAFYVISYCSESSSPVIQWAGAAVQGFQPRSWRTTTKLCVELNAGFVRVRDMMRERTFPHLDHAYWVVTNNIWITVGS